VFLKFCVFLGFIINRIKNQTYDMSSSFITTKSPIAIMALYGIKASPSFVFSKVSDCVYAVGEERIKDSSSPVFTSKA